VNLSGTSAFLFVLLLPSAASALPSFSRRYQTPCTTCHTTAPQLSSFGETFRRNGFFWPDSSPITHPRIPLDLAVTTSREAPQGLHTSTGFRRRELLSAESISLGKGQHASYALTLYQRTDGRIPEGALGTAFVALPAWGGTLRAGQFAAVQAQYAPRARLTQEAPLALRASVGSVALTEPLPGVCYEHPLGNGELVLGTLFNGALTLTPQSHVGAGQGLYFHAIHGRIGEQRTGLFGYHYGESALLGLLNTQMIAPHLTLLLAASAGKSLGLAQQQASAEGSWNLQQNLTLTGREEWHNGTTYPVAALTFLPLPQIQLSLESSLERGQHNNTALLRFLL